jgi:hypothetical protein
MKCNPILPLALVLSVGLAGAAVAQGRHDERPHGYNKAKAEAAAAAKVDQPAATGGRHDERPHGAAKPAATPKAKGSAKAPATPASVPEVESPRSGK